MTIEIRWNAKLDFCFQPCKKYKKYKVLLQKNPHIYYELKTFLGQKKLHGAEEIISLITMTKQTLL